MRFYQFGLDVLGGEMVSIEVPVARGEVIGGDTADDILRKYGAGGSGPTSAEMKRAFDADAKYTQKRMKAAANAFIFSGIAGTVLGTVGGALLWKKHRVAGALIGGLLVGPAVGFGTGFAIAQAVGPK